MNHFKKIGFFSAFILPVLLIGGFYLGGLNLLLIHAFVGQDWKRIYDFALANEYRFLSYGDGSLLWLNK